MTTPENIRKLVETFEQNLSEYRTHKNETELRRQFLDPFFEALGWDVSNTKGYDERRKEVAHELSVEIDGQQKKADYAFRTGTDKFDFLVEAKKPSVKIESNPQSAFQVKRYGWSAKLPINILTDFEHFAVYDCRVKPNHKDKVSAGRILLIHYKDYIEKWDEIAALFSPDAIRKGALDKYTEGAKGRKGTADVDDDFLAEIERWRDLLARNIANRNKDRQLNENQLNYAVQMTIDRIVFLRIAEERGMEEYGHLKNLCDPHPSSPKSDNKNFSKKEKDSMSDLGEVPAGRRAWEGSIYSELKQYFLKADERYNSGLFHFKTSNKTLRDSESLRVSNPDTVTSSLQIDDKVLRDIIENLYEPKSPYAFAYIPADILGSVYERFLGKVIRLTASGQAKVEDKPEVRKAGGVYYTPVYIVEYIVRNTVGKLIDSKRPEGLLEKVPVESSEPFDTLRTTPSGRSMTPKEVSELKIVDPACGSGSFLLGAYQYLLNWHLDWYTQNDPEKHLKNKVLLTQDNKTYRLSMNEKKRILLNNIHGVDLDPQAVEVTKLSLLLKVVEDPGQLTMFEEGHILPDLGNNIKCGNSLIGMDYFDGQLMADPAEIARVNPFDWKSAFPAVFKRGGFDVVIGNPPYIRIQAMQEWASEQVAFYKKQYQAASKGNYDIYVVFIEKALSLLNKKGELGFILPHKFFNAQYGEPVRKLVAQGKHISKVVHFGDQQIFDGATTYTCLLFLNKQGRDEFEFTKISDLENWRGSQSQTSEVFETSEVSGMIKAANVSSTEWNFTVGKGIGLIERFSQMPVKLENIAKRIFQGFKTGADPVFILEERENGNYYSNALKKEVSIEKTLLRPLYKSGEMKRYVLHKNSRHVIFPYKNGVLIDWREISTKTPKTAEYLMACKSLLANRENGRWVGSQWYCYSRNQALEIISSPKILTADLNPFANYCYDESGEACFPGGAAGGYGIVLDESMYLYVLGLLNSKAVDYYHKTISTNFRGGWFGYDAKIIRNIPIRTINFSDPAEKAKHDQMVALVERMLALHKNLASAKTPQEKESMQRQVQSTDAAIDKLVYELYGLTEEEIEIVKG